MVVSVFVALLLGRVFDREGVHIFIPIISLASVFLAFSNDPRIAVAGSLVWGAGIGLFEPLLQASIAESTSLERRGKVYGHILAYVVIIEAAALIAYLWLLLIRDPG